MKKEGIYDVERMKAALQVDSVDLDKLIAYRGDIFIIDTKEYLPWLERELKKLKTR